MSEAKRIGGQDRCCRLGITLPRQDVEDDVGGRRRTPAARASAQAASTAAKPSVSTADNAGFPATPFLCKFVLCTFAASAVGILRYG
jgi:hypothetical protein